MNSVRSKILQHQVAKKGIRKFEFLIFLSENQPVEWKLLKGNMAEVYNCIHPNNLVERF